MPVTKTDSKELTSAIETLREIIKEDELDRRQPSGPAAVYTTMVTIWMMTMQRLGGGKSLNAVVKDVLAHSRDLLPNNRRLREGTLSETSGAYAEARSRVALETVEFFANRVCDSLIDASPSWFDGRRAFILDGTTITLPPTPELQKAFPPATNQHGDTVWPVALLLVAHELQSGCALPPEIGAMYGANNTSEARLSEALVRRLPAGSIVLADSGSGIFSVAYATVQAGHKVLFRLTKSRFKPLRRRAAVVAEGDGYQTWRLRWTPSGKDRQSHPELPEDAAVDVWLHEVPLDNGETLYLVTTLPVDAEQAGEFYQRRYDVEARHPRRQSDVEHRMHPRQERVDGEEGTVDVDRGLQLGGSIPPPSRGVGRGGSASFELHGSLEHVREFSVDATAVPRGRLAIALRTGVADRVPRQAAEPAWPKLSSSRSSPPP
jgi:hypothetical protein